jgi:hypothetical protein
MTPVTKHWVFELPLRMQTVLMAATRGADGVPKEDKSKAIVRALRSLLFNNADLTNSFMKDDVTEEQIEKFASDIDHYYVHFLMHLTHAIEIVGYKHPDNYVRGKWLTIYKRLCKSLHLNFETENQLDVRLGHTPEYLDELEKRKVKKPEEAAKVAIPRPAAPLIVVDEEAKKKAQAERPIELEDVVAPKLLDAVPRGNCTCGHAYADHYQLKPETNPDLYECNGGMSSASGERPKCKCSKYVENKPAPALSQPTQRPTGGAVLAAIAPKTCVCGHLQSMHTTFNTGGRCASCGCTNFMDAAEARRTGDAGTGTSRNESRYRGSS